MVGNDLKMRLRRYQSGEERKRLMDSKPGQVIMTSEGNNHDVMMKFWQSVLPVVENICVHVCNASLRTKRKLHLFCPCPIVLDNHVFFALSGFNSIFYMNFNAEMLD